MNQYKTILVDQDSIVADFYFGCIKAYTKETGHIPPNDVLNTWNAKFPNGKDCFPYFSQPGFFRDLDPIPGALEFMKEMKDYGHDVLILSTATLTNAPGEKYEWFDKHAPWLHRNQIMFSGRKELVRGDILIDDHQKNTGPWLAKNPDGVAIGIEYPYSMGHKDCFTHLVPSYLDFSGAWAKIRAIVHGL